MSGDHGPLYYHSTKGHSTVHVYSACSFHLTKSPKKPGGQKTKFVDPDGGKKDPQTWNRTHEPDGRKKPGVYKPDSNQHLQCKANPQGNASPRLHGLGSVGAAPLEHPDFLYTHRLFHVSYVTFLLACTSPCSHMLSRFGIGRLGQRMMPLHT